jgi:hypothetical protein
MLAPDVAEVGYSRTVVLMDTFITIRLSQATHGCEALVDRAFGWFRQVEAACSRFDLQSEVMALTQQVG